MSDATWLRGRAAVSGVGMTEIGDHPDRSHLSLAVEAFRLALDDAGLKKTDIDGLIVLSYGADYGRFLAPMLQHAALVVASGMARNVAIVHGRRRRPFGQQADHEMWRQGLGPHGESPTYGAVGPVFGAAVAMQRYLEMYGGTPDDLAPIAVALRKHARLNPAAIRTKPLTREDYIASRGIIEPLRLLDCCQNNDGGAALIVSAADVARDCRKKPVYMSGMQGVHAGRQYHNLTLPGLGVAQQDIFRYEPDELTCNDMAGVTREDVDALTCYDCFSPMVLFSLERFGFCKPGEALEFIKGGRIEPGGELP